MTEPNDALNIAEPTSNDLSEYEPECWWSCVVYGRRPIAEFFGNTADEARERAQAYVAALAANRGPSEDAQWAQVQDARLRLAMEALGEIVGTSEFAAHEIASNAIEAVHKLAAERPVVERDAREIQVNKALHRILSTVAETAEKSIRAALAGEPSADSRLREALAAVKDAVSLGPDGKVWGKKRRTPNARAPLWAALDALFAAARDQTEEV